MAHEKQEWKWEFSGLIIVVGIPLIAFFVAPTFISEEIKGKCNADKNASPINIGRCYIGETFISFFKNTETNDSYSTSSSWRRSRDTISKSKSISSYSSITKYSPITEEDYPEIPYKRNHKASYEWDLIIENNKGHLLLSNPTNRHLAKKLHELISIEDFANRVRKEYAKKNPEYLRSGYDGFLRATSTNDFDNPSRDAGYCWATSKIEGVKPDKPITAVDDLADKYLNKDFGYAESYGLAMSVSVDTCRWWVPSSSGWS